MGTCLAARSRCGRGQAAVTGACPAIRKAVFDRWGRFDERFPVNYSDADLCLRARKAGYDIVTEPAAWLRHHECQSPWPWIRLSERLRGEERWAEDLKDDDSFYSPHLTKTGGDATLDLESGGDLAARLWTPSP
jgi:GT2 family glycosyltransferase